jgi:hypothetical protein
LNINNLKKETIKLNNKLNDLLKEKEQLKNNALEYLELSNESGFIFENMNFALGVFSFYKVILDYKYIFSFIAGDKFEARYAVRHNDPKIRKEEFDQNINKKQFFVNRISVPTKKEIELYKIIDEHFIKNISRDIFNNELFFNILTKIKDTSKKIKNLRDVIFDNNYVISLNKHDKTIKSFNKLIDIKEHKNIYPFLNKKGNVKTDILHFLYKNDGILFFQKKEYIHAAKREVNFLKKKKIKRKPEDQNYYIIDLNTFLSMEKLISNYNIDKKYLEKHQHFSKLFIPYEDLRYVFRKGLIAENVNNF